MGKCIVLLKFITNNSTKISLNQSQQITLIWIIGKNTFPLDFRHLNFDSFDLNSTWIIWLNVFDPFDFEFSKH